MLFDLKYIPMMIYDVYTYMMIFVYICLRIYFCISCDKRYIHLQTKITFDINSVTLKYSKLKMALHKVGGNSYNKDILSSSRPSLTTKYTPLQTIYTENNLPFLTTYYNLHQPNSKSDMTSITTTQFTILTTCAHATSTPPPTHTSPSGGPSL